MTSTTNTYIIAGILATVIAIYNVPFASAAPSTGAQFNDFYVTTQNDFQKISQEANKKYANSMVEIQATYNLAKLNAKQTYLDAIKNAKDNSKMADAKSVYNQMMLNAKISYLNDVKNTRTNYFNELQQIISTYSKPLAAWNTA